MFEKLSKNLFGFFSKTSSSNVFLIVGKRNVLIDSGSEENSPLLKSSLKEIGFSPHDVDLVLHTHGHCDHFSGDILFKKASIQMHEFDAEYVNIKDSSFTASALLGTKFFPKIKSFFSENETISLGTFDLNVVFSPGHTEGSVCFLEKKQKILFSGDTLFKGFPGRFDLVSGDKQKLTSSLLKLKKLDFETLLPGHGEGVFEKQSKNIDKALECLS